MMKTATDFSMQVRRLVALGAFCGAVVRCTFSAQLLLWMLCVQLS